MIGQVQHLMLGPCHERLVPSAGPVSSRGGGSRGLMRGCVSGRTAGEAHSLIREFGWGRLPRQYFSGLQEM